MLLTPIFHFFPFIRENTVHALEPVEQSYAGDYFIIFNLNLDLT
jgi:hypothetical protein